MPVVAVAAGQLMGYGRAAMDAISDQTLPRLSHATLDVRSQLRPAQRHALALRDIAGGLALWRLGFTLGWLDIKLKYRGSVLGPFWLTISTGVMVAAMGGLYGTLFHMDLRSYLPFLAMSLVLWNSIGGLVTEACSTFTQSDGVIRSVRMPFFVHALRVVVRTIVSFLHNLPVIFITFAVFGIWPSWVCLESILGLMLWTIDAFAACFLLGAFCARFRDIPPIVGSVMQIAFFITPIVWRADQLGRKGWWLPFNPFDSLLEIVRQPVLGQAASIEVWILSLVYSALLCAVSWLMFARVRARLAYWM